MNYASGWRWRALGFAALVAATGNCGASDDAGSARPSGGGLDSGVDADEPIVVGTGKACTPQTHEVIGIKVALDANWPATAGTMGCDESSGCKGTIYIWLLSRFDVSGQMMTGTTTTCGNQIPTVELTQLGSESEGVPSGGAKVTIQFPSSVWDAVAMNPLKAPVSSAGVLGGWNVGSSFKVDPTAASFGLKPSSPLTAGSATWPASQGDIASTDMNDDDNDGHPGVTAIPSSTDGNSLPATGLSTTPPYAPQADKLYLVLRTGLSFYGSATSCTDMSGTAKALVFNEHVVGCHVQGGGDCTPTQWDFVDQMSTVYVGSGVTIPPGVAAPSFAPAGITGTFTSKLMSNDADGGGIDCAAVRAALP
jgi:hypothetical protein